MDVEVIIHYIVVNLVDKISDLSILSQSNCFYGQ